MQDNVSLKNLLALLLQECGEQRILDALSEAKIEVTKDPKAHRSRSVAKPKPSILQLISRATATDTQKAVLMNIGGQFENKIFLPTANDARSFLEDHGMNPRNVRQRQDAVRPTLEVLLTLDDAELKKIATGNAYRGPSQLGPLADAIRAAGASLRKGGSDPLSKQAPLDHGDLPDTDEKAKRAGSHPSLAEKPKHSTDA